MWKVPVLEARASLEKTDTDLVPVTQDSTKKATAQRGPYAAWVERFRKGDVFTAKPSQLQFVRFGGKGGAEDVLFVGLGPSGELTEEKARQAGGLAWAKLNAEKSRSVAVRLDAGSPLNQPRLARAFAEGLILNNYHWVKHRSRRKDEAEKYLGPSRVTFVTTNADARKHLDIELAQVQSICEAVNIARDWSNEPSNYGTPEFYAADAARLARQAGLKAKILKESDAQREKMGLFLGVGQGSEREGRIVVLEYAPKGKTGSKPKTIALVGKGVTFDSGGISIKPSLRMEDMKHDMTGAATIMGAILLASRWKVPNRVIAVLAFTENMPDGSAIQPGNVITSRAGKTVEVINTDAEGRLILADVLDYAQDRKPDAVVDVATLTGAVSIALGKQACAILGNDDALIEAVKRSGELNGERIWQLPLWDEYFDDLKSDTADMRNSANDSYGGTIRGAIFLKQFIRKGVAWAHLDIAAMAYGVSHLSYFPKKGATGAYVRTLAQLAADL